MPLFIISIILQVALVVHIVKTGRNTTWIWIVVMLPVAGSIAYLIIEVLPGLTSGRAARKVKQNIDGVVNPNKEMNKALHDFSVTDTVDNSMKLAQEFVSKGQFEEAKALYEKCMKGLYEHDPYIMAGLAQAEYGLKNYGRVKQLLDGLIEKNPDFKDANTHLLYARTAVKLGDVELALKEYEVLDNYFPGPEATYRYAMLLKTRGEQTRVKALLEKILHDADISGSHYKTIYKEWINLAKGEYKSL